MNRMLFVAKVDQAIGLGTDIMMRANQNSMREVLYVLSLFLYDPYSQMFKGDPRSQPPNVYCHDPDLWVEFRLKSGSMTLDDTPRTHISWCGDPVFGV